MKLGEAYKAVPLRENFNRNPQLTECRMNNKRKRCVDDSSQSGGKTPPLDGPGMELGALREMGLCVMDDHEVDGKEPAASGVVSLLGGDCAQASGGCAGRHSAGNADAHDTKPAPPDTFFLYRRKRPESQGGDCFSCLSDELVLMVFRQLPKRALVQCAQVCRRWRRVAYDETLWARLDLGLRSVRPGSLSHILARGTTTLRLAQAEVTDPVFLNDNMYPARSSKLQFLDLSMAIISERGLAGLLQSCSLLQKLSLERCHLTDQCCSLLAANTALEVLNLSSCTGITTTGLAALLAGCRKLVSLNVSWTSLSEESLTYLCLKLPASVRRLNISGCRKNLSDKNVSDLVSTCPELTELDISDCTSLTPDAVHHVCGLPRLEHLAASRCYSIPPATFVELQVLKSLLYLDVFGMMGEKCLASLQAHLPHVEVNKFLFSAVARPTVGNKRTSIWNLRVRDC